MLGKKKLLLSLVLVAVMLAGGITAGTQLLIEQPVSASITVEGLGTSPSFNIIDNVFNPDEGVPAERTAGRAAGYINASDFYVIGFGATNPGGAWALSFGKSQTATVGNGTTDYVFKLQNNYANPMTVGLLKKAVSYESGSFSTLGTGVVIKFMNAGTGVAQWTLTGALTSTYGYTDWTITPAATPLTLASGADATFYLKVENDAAVVSPAGGWTPRVRFQATAD